MTTEPQFYIRPWLETTYFPAIDGRLLYVGVADYTMPYYDMIQNPNDFETIDIDPKRSEFGAAIHYEQDFLTFQPESPYKHVAIVGLDPNNMPFGTFNWFRWSQRLLNHADRLLQPGGTLLFGGYVGENVSQLPALEMFRRYDWIEEYLRPNFAKDTIAWWIQKES